MQITFFIRQFPALSETFITNQLIELKKRGHEISIVSEELLDGHLVHESVRQHDLLSHAHSEPIPRNYFIRYLKAFRLLLRQKGASRRLLLESMNWFKYGRSSFNLKNFYRLFPTLQLDHRNTDVVFAHFGSEGIFAATLMEMGLFPEAKLITAFHGIDAHPSKKVNPGFYRKLFATACLITANSSYTKQQLLNLECPPAKIRILPEGLNTNYFKRHAEAKSVPITIAFVGRLVAFKGADKIVPLIKTLKSRLHIPFQMVVVGDGELMPALQQAVAEEHLEDTILLKGRLLQSEIIDELSKAHVFLYPGRITPDGRQENQGLVLQEAQALELPVVCSNIGGMAEGVIDGETGFLLAENDLEGFVDKLEFLIEHPEVAREMGKKGREFVVRNFDVQVLGDKLERLLQEAASGGVGDLEMPPLLKAGY